LADDDEEHDLEAPVLRPLVWLGNSRRNIRAFPAEVQKAIGDELQLIQFGGMPRDTKPFKGVGGGVFEIALRHDAEAYRTVVAVQLGRRIYVLHASRRSRRRESPHRNLI
jgi:phage-related protein